MIQNIKDFLRAKLKDDSVIILNKNSPFTHIKTDYAIFYFDENINTVDEIEEYHIDDIRPTDTVLDIGSCIGAFSLKVCRIANKVFAVEPIMTDRLKKNITLNSVNNITVLDCGLGEGEQNIEWDGHKKTIKCISLSGIIKQCGRHIDFLKIDCEGGEWSINSDELKGIRRIEAEIHCPMKKVGEFGKILKEAGFEYTIQSSPSLHLHLIHAKAIT